METPLSRLVGAALEKRHLLFGSLELTYSCNFACRFCYNPVDRKGQERQHGAPAPQAPPLSFPEIVDLLDQLREMETLYFTVTGGEPMLHPDFWQVLEAVKERAFVLRVFTNGSLIDERAADRFAEICPNCIEMSIYGASEESYRQTNRAPQAFPKVLRALGLLQERGIQVFLKCVVTRIVEGELEAIQAIGDRFGCPVYYDAVLTPSDDGQTYPLALAASDGALRRLYSDPRFHIGASPFERGDGDSICNIGRALLHVDPYGVIFPCIQFRQPLGNLRTHRIKDLWLNSPDLARLSALGRSMPQRLRDATDAHEFCSHCMGLSRSHYGDPLKVEEQHLRTAAIRKEVFALRGPKG